MVGLKHPPESDPTILIKPNNVKTTVNVPMTPSLVGAVFPYLVCKITETNKIVKNISIKNTCHNGKLLSSGFSINVSYFCYKPQAMAMPVYPPKISASMTVKAIGIFFFQFLPSTIYTAKVTLILKCPPPTRAVIIAAMNRELATM